MVNELSSRPRAVCVVTLLARGAAAALGVAILSLLPMRPALAQGSTVDIIVPVLNPARLAESSVLLSTAIGPGRTETPQAPFAAPQVGPAIKLYYEDIIDRRTTAWIPESLEALAALTPVEMGPMIASGERWVQVDLSEQTLVAWSGGVPIRAFRISSGLPATPTVTGTFHIRAKVRTQLMEGGSYEEDNYYYLPNVQWVQYFYKDYGIHGTYWHNDFGRPKSHGCVNMTNADAAWVWEYLSPDWDGSAWQTVTGEETGSLVIVTE